MTDTKSTKAMGWKMTEPLALLRLLDALDAFNEFAERAQDKEPEPEATHVLRANAQVMAVVAGQLGVPPWFAFECFSTEPVKEVRGIRDWILGKREEEGYDPVLQLWRYARKHGRLVDEESLEEARRESLGDRKPKPSGRG